MILAPVAQPDRVERQLWVEGRRITIGFASVSTHESLSVAAHRLGSALVADAVGGARWGVRVALLEPSGRPVAVADGGRSPCSISLSHVPGLVAAAICLTGGVGIDVVDPASGSEALACWFSRQEMDSSARASVPTAAMWGAKEASYKAAGLDEPFRPLAVSIQTESSTTFRWCLAGAWRTVSGAGRFFSFGGHLVAVAAARTTAEEAGASGGPEFQSQEQRS
jgi:phosphopantetheinyl transferase